MPKNRGGFDPTRTTTLRRVFAQNMRGRFSRVNQLIQNLVVSEDAFGLKGKERQEAAIRPLVFNTRWSFNTDAEKVENFVAWLADTMDREILGSVDATGEAWLNAYIQQGYEQGAGASFANVKKSALAGKEAFFEGSKAEFLRQSFAHPQTIEKLTLLTSRTFNDLKGVTDAMAAQIQRSLADGFVQGLSPRDIGRNLAKTVDKIGKNRATTIARTEIIRTYNEGALDSLENLGVTEIGVSVEWSTTGDTLVCPLCAELEGIVLTVKEARSIVLPRHPNCRCAWIPANVGESTKGQVRSHKDIRKAIDASVKKEIPKKSKRTLKEQKARTTWAGADARISKKRPKSILED